MQKDKKSLAETHPEVAKQWHPTKNGDLTPYDVTKGSHKKVWWKCPKGEDHYNIFSGRQLPLNQDYFKTLWGRFKRVSKLLEQGQTLYSFRHTGAIEIFKRTGSITKLQKAMGHSSINVSLTYLRGLEIAELKEEDMPVD